MLAITMLCNHKNYLPLFKSYLTLSFEQIAAIMAVIICGAILLPFPAFWVCVMRMLALVTLLYVAPFNKEGTLREILRYLVMMAAILMVCLSVVNLKALSFDVFEYLRTLQNTTGKVYSFKFSVMLSLLDAGILAGLGLALWHNAPMRQRIAIALVAVFIGLYHALPPSNLLHGNSNTITFLYIWNGWFIAALSVWLLALHTSCVPEMLSRSIGLAGLVLAVLALVQHVIGDYSYIIEHSDVSQYLYRVRATYYNHPPAALATGLALMVTLGRRDVSYRHFATIAVMAGALWLNSTRAVNVAVVSGCIMMLVIHWVLAYPRLKKICVVVVMALLATQIVYEKPDSFAPAVQQAVEKDKLSQLVASNESRSSLMEEGLQQLLRNPWTGQGIGNIVIPLSGYFMSGEISTYSSHSLLVDIALASGLPSLMIFATIVGLALLGYARHAWYSRKTVDALNAVLPGLVCAIIMWLVASLFFTQASNLVPMIALILCGFGLFLFTRSAPQAGVNATDDASRTCRLPRYAVMGICTVAVIVSTLNSMSVSVPLYELFSKQYGAIGASIHDRIYTNSPVIRYLSKKILHYRYTDSQAEVRMLQDNPERLPYNAWIVWDPGFDANYPRLFAKQGYNYNRGYGLFPAFVMPNGWQVAGVMQRSVSILRAGNLVRKVSPYFVGTLSIDDLPVEGKPYRILLKPNRSLRIQIDTPQHFDGVLMVQGGTQESDLHIAVEDVHGKRRDLGWFKLKTQTSVNLPGHKISAIIITANGPNLTAVEPYILDGFYTDIAANAVLRNADGDTVTELTDQRRTSVWRAPSQPSYLYVDASKRAQEFNAYQLYVAQQRDIKRPAAYHWDLEASRDNKHWVTVDKQRGFASSYAMFYLKKPVNYPYYRFRFFSDNADATLAFAELQMFSKAPVR